MKIEVLPSKYGKRITVIRVNADKKTLKAVARSLKRRLAVGGTVRDGEIILQGDHSDKADLIEEVLRLYNIE